MLTSLSSLDIHFPFSFLSSTAFERSMLQSSSSAISIPLICLPSVMETLSGRDIRSVGWSMVSCACRKENRSVEKERCPHCELFGPRLENRMRDQHFYQTFSPNTTKPNGSSSVIDLVWGPRGLSADSSVSQIKHSNQICA